MYSDYSTLHISYTFDIYLQVDVLSDPRGQGWGLTMDYKDGVREMLAQSGLTASATSKDMGKSPLYITRALSTHRDVKVKTLRDIAQACGWSLCLRGPHGETIDIDA